MERSYELDDVLSPHARAQKAERSEINFRSCLTRTALKTLPNRSGRRKEGMSYEQSVVEGTSQKITVEKELSRDYFIRYAVEYFKKR